MMPMSCKSLVALCAFLSAAPELSAAGASDLQESADTAGLIETIEQKRGEATEADLKAAQHLNATGDRAYRRKD
jgi:hypothetical protein